MFFYLNIDAKNENVRNHHPRMTFHLSPSLEDLGNFCHSTILIQDWVNMAVLNPTNKWRLGISECDTLF